MGWRKQPGVLPAAFLTAEIAPRSVGEPGTNRVRPGLQPPGALVLVDLELQPRDGQGEALAAVNDGSQTVVLDPDHNVAHPQLVAVIEVRPNCPQAEYAPASNSSTTQPTSIETTPAWRARPATTLLTKRASCVRNMTFNDRSAGR